MKFIKIRQSFEAGVPVDLNDKLCAALPQLSAVVKPGMKIAVAVGSRGISKLHEIVSAVVQFVKTQGAHPFIIPAMGSHGGATARGQEAVLQSYGISGETVGAPVRAGMDTVRLPESPGLPVSIYMDRIAYESDGVILVNRIKPHTDYHGMYESGLAKMSVIGLGNHKQAMEIHRLGLDGLREIIPRVAKEVLNNGKILAGIAIVENAYDQVTELCSIMAKDILTEEPKLLEIARCNMASLPVDALDVLVIDQIGKDISGTGLDPNIVGRLGIPGQADPEKPSISSIVLNDLTEATHGNAIGIGLADVITRNLFEKIDFDTMYKNVFTSSFLERGKIPLIADDMADAMNYALRNCGETARGQARIIRIKDTLRLSECYVSLPVWEELNSQTGIEQISESEVLLDGNNALTAF